jgi:hypothetical protein
VSVIPAAPAAAVLAAAVLAAVVPTRWSRVVAALVAVAALAAVLSTRGLWEADVRRGVFIASAARGRWLDRSVDGLVTACALTLAGSARGSRWGYALGAAAAAGALLAGWAAG